MKVTRRQLRQIIQEEFYNLNEAVGSEDRSWSSVGQARTTAMKLLDYPLVLEFKNTMELISRSEGKREHIAYSVMYNVSDPQRKKILETWLAAMELASPEWFSK